MTKLTTLVIASAVAAASALPVASQQAYSRLNGESAVDMAKRIGACSGGSGIAGASFENNGSLLRVQCAGGAFVGGAGAGAGAGGGALAGGLGAGAIAAGVVAVAGIAAAASGGGSSSTTTTN